MSKNTWRSSTARTSLRPDVSGLKSTFTNFLSLETELEFEKSQEWVLRIQLKTKFCIFNWKKLSFVSSTELKRKLKFSGRNMFWGGSSTEYQSVEEEKGVEDGFFLTENQSFEAEQIFEEEICCLGRPTFKWIPKFWGRKQILRHEKVFRKKFVV